MRRFEIWQASLPSVGERPVVIVSSDQDCKDLPFVSVVPLTTDLTTRQLSSHVLLSYPELEQPHRTLCEQVTTLDKACMHHLMGYVEDPYDRFAINRALSVHLHLTLITYIYSEEESIYDVGFVKAV